jgi:hypothetical protein
VNAIPPERVDRILRETADKDPARVLPQVERQINQERKRIRGEIIFALVGVAILIFCLVVPVHHWALYFIGSFITLLGVVNAVDAVRLKRYQSIKAEYLRSRISSNASQQKTA